MNNIQVKRDEEERQKAEEAEAENAKENGAGGGGEVEKKEWANRGTSQSDLLMKFLISLTCYLHNWK